MQGLHEFETLGKANEGCGCGSMAMRGNLEHLHLLMSGVHLDHVRHLQLLVAGEGDHVGQVARHVGQGFMRLQLPQWPSHIHPL